MKRLPLFVALSSLILLSSGCGEMNNPHRDYFGFKIGQTVKPGEAGSRNVLFDSPKVIRLEENEPEVTFYRFIPPPQAGWASMLETYEIGLDANNKVVALGFASKSYGSFQETAEAIDAAATDVEKWLGAELQVGKIQPAFIERFRRNRPDSPHERCGMCMAEHEYVVFSNEYSSQAVMGGFLHDNYMNYSRSCGNGRGEHRVILFIVGYVDDKKNQ